MGWLLCSVASKYIEAYDHWVAFSLLFLLGAHMIRESFKVDDEEEEESPNSRGILGTALTGLATSIDAMTPGTPGARAATLAPTAYTRSVKACPPWYRLFEGLPGDEARPRQPALCGAGCPYLAE